MSFDEVTIPNDLIVPASFAGLIEWKNDCWYVTELGQQVLMDYVDRMANES